MASLNALEDVHCRELSAVRVTVSDVRRLSERTPERRLACRLIISGLAGVWEGDPAAIVIRDICQVWHDGAIQRDNN